MWWYLIFTKYVTKAWASQSSKMSHIMVTIDLKNLKKWKLIRNSKKNNTYLKNRNNFSKLLIQKSKNTFFWKLLQYETCHNVSWDQRVDMCNCQLPMFAFSKILLKNHKENTTSYIPYHTSKINDLCSSLNSKEMLQNFLYL